MVDRLAQGLVTLSKKRDVQLVQGKATFESSDRVRVSGDQTAHVSFEHAILATGSRPIALPGTAFGAQGRVMSSTGALELSDIPGKLLVVGAGYVGMELGSVYATLGSRVTLVELAEELLPGTDRDLVWPLERRAREAFEAIHLGTRVVRLAEYDDRVEVVLEGKPEDSQQVFDRVLVAIGREPNSVGYWPGRDWRGS